MMMTMMRKNLIKAAALLLALLLLPAGVLAAENIDTKRAVQLTVMFRDDGVGLAGAKMDIYRIASLDKTGKRALVAPFNRYNVNINVGSESALAGLAGTLEGFVLRDKIAPTASGTTSGAGMAVFPRSGATLKQGLYLVTGGRYRRGSVVYTIQPAIVQLPYWDTAGKRWSYDLIISAKYEADEDSPNPEYITRKVLKVWAGNQKAEKLPKEVEVSLLCDGEVFDTVRLNAANLWRHTWPELEAEHHWTVVEKEIKDYKVVVTREGITFVVTNTYDPKKPVATPTPKPQRTPTPTPKPSSTPTPTPTPSGSALPQTGQLWWPVPMLVCAGPLLIVIGLLRRRES